MYSYNIVTDYGDPVSVTAFFDQTGTKAYVASSEHPMFNDILEALRERKPARMVINMFDAKEGLVNRFKSLSKTLKIDGTNNQLYYEGQLLHGALADTVAKYYYEKHDDFGPLVKFLDKVQQNPSEHSKSNLFRWLVKHNFSIDSDGDLMAYKGINANWTSIHAGGAYVDGVWVNGNVPNQPGTTISMLRDKVQFNPAVGCSFGLHAGNWRYAHSFSRGVTVLVKINPADVVSVPTDSNDEKMRVSRYHVVRECHAEIPHLVLKEE